jgi:hypothetical protein
MPLRFRRSIRIAPGLRLGLGRRGVSASATLPGTGISYTLTTTHFLEPNITPPQSAKPRYTSTARSIDRMSATASRPITPPIRPTDTLALRSTIACDATRRPLPAFGATSTRKIGSSRTSVVSGSNVTRLWTAGASTTGPACRPRPTSRAASFA